MAEEGSLLVCMAQKANMEAIFQSIADGILTVDRELRITNVNRAGRAMLGAGAGEVLGMHACEALPCRLWDLHPILARSMEEDRGVRERENLLARADGSELRVLFSTSRLVDGKGETAGAVIILRDITHIRELEVRLEERGSLHALVGRSHAMQELFALIEQVAPTESTVLIQGESGTGKELIADAIHKSGSRQDGPFVKVNCSALSEGLLESELFGHVRGAFTGATHDRKGRFEMAAGGTIFLDEVGDLSERIQVKLLRVLQEKEVERVGESRVIRIDARVLAATHQPLRKLADEGRFRHDLFYRLNVIPLQVPPLRERMEDIPQLVSLFLGTLARKMGKGLEGVSRDATRVLMEYRWPGNVRELRNAIEHAAVKCRGSIVLVEDLPSQIVAESGDDARGGEASPGGRLSAPPGRAEGERRAILRALEKTAWHRGRAAALLEIDRTTLWRRMKRLGIGRREG